MSDKFQNKYRIESARLKNWDYGSQASYFVTICTKDRLHYFGEVINREMILNDVGKIVETEWLKTFEIRPDMNLTMGEYKVMPNHFHAIICIGDNEYNMGRGAERDTDDGPQRDTDDGPQRRDAMHCVSTIGPNDPNDHNVPIPTIGPNDTNNNNVPIPTIGPNDPTATNGLNDHNKIIDPTATFDHNNTNELIDPNVTIGTNPTIDPTATNTQRRGNGRDAMHCVSTIGRNDQNDHNVPIPTIGPNDPNVPIPTIGPNDPIETIGCNDPNAIITPNQKPKNQFGPQSKNLSSIIRGFKIGVTTNGRLINPDFAWQPRFHDHIIRDDESFQNISNYIKNNPANWKEDKFFK